MTHTYKISGITCNGCVAKVKSELLKIGDIKQADVKLTAPQATIKMEKHIPVEVLQSALQKAGHYTITEADSGMHYTAAGAENEVGQETRSWFEMYKPVLLIFFYISVVSVIAATSADSFNWMTGMRVFMSSFFLAFSFFKLLDIKGFADSYSTYDIIAKKFSAWGFIYPFIEFFLGIAYAINFQPLITNAGTFFVMTISIIGVLQSVLNKRKIRCACLGAVFNLPMSTITIIEDALMVVMSGVTLILFA
jgi:copper chaperone CopZ